MTKIEWTHREGTKPESWNPIAGCSAYSAGCANCYARRDSWRIMNNPRHPERYNGIVEKTPRGEVVWTGIVNLDTDEVERPLRWRKERTVFVCSMSDLFHSEVPDTFIADVWRTMARCRQHTFLVLTKRPERMRYWVRLHYGQFDASYRAPEASIWLGVTVESSKYTHRLDHLTATPAALRYVSVEPMLGDEFIDLHPWLFSCPDCGERPTRDAIYGSNGRWRFDGERWQHHHGYPIGHVRTVPDPLIDWTLIGGESGSDARPFNQRVARDLIRRCRGAGVAVFVKQLGSVWAREHGLRGKASDPSEWPEDLRVREFPR